MTAESDRRAGLFARLSTLAEEHRELEARLADPETLADPAELQRVGKRYHELSAVADAVVEHDRLVADSAAASELLEFASDDERGALSAEIDRLSADLDELADRVRVLLIPTDPDAGRAVIMEIRGAEGGEEANLFARDLLDMYRAYAQQRGWTVEVLSTDVSDLGGINHVTFVVRGADAWERLKFEGGPHRVQRVPVTESQGRVHTSSATVAVLPEVDEVEVSIDDVDLEVDVYRSSGAGGQHVNTTDSAVRITHRPSGIVVTMQDERSQLQNRARAMQVLRARLHAMAVANRDADRSQQRRSQLGGGGRSEKIRTYNFKESRVTDHRIGLTIHRLSDILGGDLDYVIGPLLDDERERLLADER
ncbi:MAG: peptide chain release factor 1 [Ilumatobacteraceae bacterium]